MKCLLKSLIIDPINASKQSSNNLAFFLPLQIISTCFDITIYLSKFNANANLLSDSVYTSLDLILVKNPSLFPGYLLNK